jgi:mono/diheme cytochrome c family protein
MTVSKVPKALILFVILALAGAVVIAGCGGGGSSSSESTAEEAAPPAEEEPAEEEAPAEEPKEEAEETAGQERSGESSLIAEGKTVFTTNCASCHTLKAAGASGTVGPNLDELEPDLATVEHQVVNGGGPMPAFGNEGILNAKEIKAVATYVSTVAGTG